MPINVVPLVGTWIEIVIIKGIMLKEKIVVPLVGTWIEITDDLTS